MPIEDTPALILGSWLRAGKWASYLQMGTNGQRFDFCTPLAEAAAAQTLSTWLSARGMGLVSADELHHETYQKDRQQRGLPEGQTRRIM